MALKVLNRIKYRAKARKGRWGGRPYVIFDFGTFGGSGKQNRLIAMSATKAKVHYEIHYNAGQGWFGSFIFYFGLYEF